MIAVQRVPAAAEVVIRSVRGQHIVDVVVKALKTERRTHLVPFSGMVEHHIQDDVDLIVVEGFDQML